MDHVDNMLVECLIWMKAIRAGDGLQVKERKT